MSADLEPKFTNPLEQALAECLIKLTPPKKRKNEGKPTLSDFRNPELWYRVRCVALMHLDTNTLLGNFVEYHHPKDSTARWLHHEEGPHLVEATEWVSGPQWLRINDPEEERLHRGEEEVEAILDLSLPEMGIRAQAVTIFIVLAHEGIHRVELAEATRFLSDDGHSAFTLPKRLNVLSGLSLDCKLAIRAEVWL